MLFLDSLQTTDSSQRLEPDIRKQVLSLVLFQLSVTKNDIFCLKACVIICLCFFFDFRFVLDIYRAEGRTEDSSLVDEIPFYVPVVIECIYQVVYVS